MTEAMRKKWAKRYQTLLKTETKKQAMFRVREEMRAVNPEMVRSRTQIYEWCYRFSIDIA